MTSALCMKKVTGCFSGYLEKIGKRIECTFEATEETDPCIEKENIREDGLLKTEGSKGNLRTYGAAPFQVAVIHGGPGAPGGMAPVARELSANRGVLEPLQTATSLEGQVQELKTVLKDHSDLPVTLIG